MDTAVTQVGSGDDVESLSRADTEAVFQLWDHELLLGEYRDERVLDLGRAAGNLLEAHDSAPLHGLVDR